MSKFLHTTVYDLFHRITDKLHLNENTVILIIASLIGIIGGFGAVGFRTLIVSIQTITIGGSTNILDLLNVLPWYKI
ncbi:MAG: hypothetical protein R3339_01325, partial [Thermodesulfobacteriota bacterium]|nr:hypothetical protein [Thermodesulfobacteriota bacterium]